MHSAGPAGAAGYQGQVFPIEHRGQRLMVKAAYGRGPMRWLREYMLRREHRVYERLKGFEGAPHCLGLLGGRYLVLERVEGESLWQAEIRDREAFFATLFEHIEELHRRGVAHADLKRKDNLLVVAGRRPCLIDFGTAVVHRKGFHPLNHFLFRVARQFDYNAWVKHKHRYIEHAPPQDLAYYRLTRTERMARGVKRRYLAAKKRIGNRRSGSPTK
jgi:predicted Ser/Thr protein kinase